MAGEIINGRLEPIAFLSETYGVETNLANLEQAEINAKRLHDHYGILPTIGCEVEVKWSALFPDLAHEYFGEQDAYGRFDRRYADLSPARRQELDEQCRILDEIWKPRYELTRDMGIPAGSDAYWEFAQAPAYASTTLAAEVDVLMHSGLIPAGSEHSLHITLGGVAPGKGGVCLLIAAVELVGSSERRIMEVVGTSPRYDNRGWALKSKDGIRARGASELAFDQQQASELRTLAVADSESLHTTLDWAQTLGAILTAYRMRQTTEHPFISELGSLWPVYRSTIKALFEARGLPAEKSWGRPGYQQQRWTNWAQAITKSKQSGTFENATMQEIDRIVACGSEQIQTLIQQNGVAGDVVNA